MKISEFGSTRMNSWFKSMKSSNYERINKVVSGIHSTFEVESNTTRFNYQPEELKNNFSKDFTKRVSINRQNDNCKTPEKVKIGLNSTFEVLLKRLKTYSLLLEALLRFV